MEILFLIDTIAHKLHGICNENTDKRILAVFKKLKYLG